MKNWNMLLAAILLLSAIVFGTQSALAEESGMTSASISASPNETTDVVVGTFVISLNVETMISDSRGITGPSQCVESLIF